MFVLEISLEKRKVTHSLGVAIVDCVAAIAVVRTEMPLFRAQVNGHGKRREEREKCVSRQLVFIAVVDSFRHGSETTGHHLPCVCIRILALAEQNELQKKTETFSNGQTEK